MSNFDPTAVRKAVAEFVPRRPEKFQDLMPAKAVIAELRQKRASYRAVAELLTQHCLPTSKTAIAMFCHQILGEKIHTRRKPTHRRAILPNGGNGTVQDVSTAESPQTLVEPPAPASDEMPSIRTRGPRIAQVRKLNRQNNETAHFNP